MNISPVSLKKKIIHELFGGLLSLWTLVAGDGW
jgi:hypothetical protein